MKIIKFVFLGFLLNLFVFVYVYEIKELQCIVVLVLYIVENLFVIGVGDCIVGMVDFVDYLV